MDGTRAGFEDREKLLLNRILQGYFGPVEGLTRGYDAWEKLGQNGCSNSISSALIYMGVSHLDFVSLFYRELF